MKMRNRLSSCLWMLFFLLLAGRGAGAAEKPTKTGEAEAKPIPLFVPVEAGIQSVKLPVVEQRDFVGSGLFSNHTAWLAIPKHIDLMGNPKLVFYLSHSNILSKTSTVTVWFNEQPIYSMNLVPETAAKAPHEIEIPQNLLKEDLNSLEFRFFTISNVQEPCQDLDNPANWVVLHKDSSLQVPYIVRNIFKETIFERMILSFQDFSEANATF